MAFAPAWRRVFVPVLLAACAGPVAKPVDTPEPDTAPAPDGDTADTAPDTDTAPVSTCPTEAAPTCAGTVAVSPADRAADVSALAAVTWTLDPADPDATATIDGVDGEVSVDGGSVTFTPTVPFEPGRPQIARLCWCGGEEVVAFTTAAATPVSAPALVGRTWAFRLADAVAVEPPVMGPALQDYFDDVLLVQARAWEDDVLRLRFAWADPMDDALAQHPTMATENVEIPFGGNPSLRVGLDTWVYNALFDSPAYEVVLDGTFAPDGSGISDGSLTLLVDTAEWGALFGEYTPEGYCDHVAQYGDTCEACPDGSTTCTRFSWEGLTADEVTPFEIDAVRAGG